MSPCKNVSRTRGTTGARAATVFALVSACIVLALTTMGMLPDRTVEAAGARAPKPNAATRTDEVTPIKGDSHAAAQGLPAPRDRATWGLITDMEPVASSSFGVPSTFSASAYDSQDASRVTYVVVVPVDTNGAGYNSVGDDYTTACGVPLALEQFVFVGGVTNAGEIAFFNFYDSGGTHVNGFAVQFPVGGPYIWTIGLSSPFSIPGAGRVIMTTDDGSFQVNSSGQWYSSDQAILGSNDPTSMIVDGVPVDHLGPANPNIMAFELRGSMSTPTAGSAIAILPGDDGFRTGDGTAEYTFGNPVPSPCNPPLPADFFGPGSDPFEGQVALTGVPFVTNPADPNGALFAATDTIVRRWDCTPDMLVGQDAVVDIEIVALSLRSVEPITVTYNGGQNPEQWDVRVCLSDAVPQCPGTMIISRTHTNGGVYWSDFPAIPKFIFDGPGGQVEWDLGEGLTGCVDAPFTLQTPGGQPNSWSLIGEVGGPTRAEFGITSWPAGVRYNANCPGPGAVWDPADPTNRLSSGVTNFQGGLDSSGGPGAAECRASEESLSCVPPPGQPGHDTSFFSSDIDVNGDGIPDLCEGECCRPNGACEVRDAGACGDTGGIYIGNGTACAPAGACCLPDRTCLLGTTVICCELEGGQYMGDGSTACPVPPCSLPPPDPFATCTDGTDSSFFEFGGAPYSPPIPADFFGPGSDPFDGRVYLQGDPINPPTLGDTSTLVQRDAAPVDPDDPVSAMGTVPIEIVALSLVSIDPIVVTYWGGLDPELWDVRVILSETPVPPGSQLSATKTHANGGTFDTVLLVQPTFIFTQVDPPFEVRVIDTGDFGIPPLEMSATEVPFVHAADPLLDILAPSNGSFVPGVEETVPGSPSSQETRPMRMQDPLNSALHIVCPARLSGACCRPDDTCFNFADQVSCDAIGGDYQGGGSTCAGDGNGNGKDDLCESTTPDPLDPVPGPLGNRYIRVTAPGPGNLEVIRVTFVGRCVGGTNDGGTCRGDADCPGGSCDFGGFPYPSQSFLYAGPPYQAPDEDTAKPFQTFTVAPLQCEPYVHSWSFEGTIAIYGAEIIPDSEYQVQRADSSCPDLTDPACWSAPITVRTAKYGDVWANFYAPPPAPTQPDFGDISAMVRKFQGAASTCTGGANNGACCGPTVGCVADCGAGTCDIRAPRKYMCQLQPNVVFPKRQIDFKDIAADVGAFVGTSYAAIYHGPCPCPSAVTCGATPCAVDMQCGTGLCVDGFCGDECGRCAP